MSFQMIVSPKRNLLTVLIFMAAALTASAPAVSSPASQNQDSALSQLVTDVCNKKTVLLGEDNHHGSGATLTEKVRIVERLIDECDFNAVYFESSVFDFLDLQHQFDGGTASKEQLADAIGGLWSTSKEMDPLIAFLYAKGKSRDVYLAGLDPQVTSATSMYAQTRMPIDLTHMLPEPRRTACRTEIHRLTNWQYDDQHPHDETTLTRLRGCANDIRRAVAQRKRSGSTVVTAITAKNFGRYFDIRSGSSSNARTNIRDKAMFENFVWHQSYRPGKSKVIVWCATVHAAKNLAFREKDRRPLGSFIHKLQGAKAAAIGFSALGGRYASYGRQKQGKAAVSLSAATPGSLENRVFAGTREDMVYLDRGQLKSLGMISSRAISYSNPVHAQWAEVLDGLLVLRAERKLQIVRNAVPRQQR